MALGLPAPPKKNTHKHSSEDGPASSDSSSTSRKNGSGSDRGSDASESDSSSGEESTARRAGQWPPQAPPKADCLLTAAGAAGRAKQNRPGAPHVQETVVSYRAQRPSFSWHILALIIPVIMCIIIDLIPVLALMPMPLYAVLHRSFLTPSQNLKATRRGDVSSAPASLLHLRSRPPPCSDVLLCVPSAEAQCARAWPRVGVPVARLPVGLPLPPAVVPPPPPGPEPPCVNTGALSSSAPASCCSGSSPEF
jgi:hypothetical protein